MDFEYHQNEDLMSKTYYNNNHTNIVNNLKFLLTNLTNRF